MLLELQNEQEGRKIVIFCCVKSETGRKRMAKICICLQDVLNGNFICVLDNGSNKLLVFSIFVLFSRLFASIP